MANILKKLEKISKALADVNRLQILQHIAANGGVGHCAALQSCVNLAQPSISHHIKILIEADILEAVKEGRHHKYLLNKGVMNRYFEDLKKHVIPGNKKEGLDEDISLELPSPKILGPSRATAPISPDKEKPGKVTHG